METTIELDLKASPQTRQFLNNDFLLMLKAKTKLILSGKKLMSIVGFNH